MDLNRCKKDNTVLTISELLVLSMRAVDRI